MPDEIDLNNEEEAALEAAWERLRQECAEAQTGGPELSPPRSPAPEEAAPPRAED